MPSRFEELPEYRLDDLSDEQLLAYLVSAREAGAGGADTTALQHLVFRHLHRVRARVACKVPAELVDDVAHDAMVEAIQAAFDGAAIPQFHKWLNVIVSRTIADFWRGPAGRQLKLDRAGVTGGRAGADDDGAPPAEELLAEDQEGLVELEDLIAGRLAALSAVHREVVDGLVFEGCSAKDVAQRTGVTEPNAYKIAQRFRDDLRAHLEGRADAIDEPGRSRPGGTGLLA